ncbi:uncharacterized protein LOC125596632 [Brassica napus]|uniref:uncharacterized protein LOC125596632 n=1 Tax=Brassica napus TaxID=3708 RepID=UPI0020791E4F|nr:uncharacterized protein LOC125596632 [Brassica napus]
MSGDADSSKSTSGYLVTFAGGAVAWQSRLQKCVALSTTEAEFIAAVEACKELLWMKNFCEEIGFKQEKYVLLCDSQSAICLGKNSTFHSKSKHIQRRYHWIRDVVASKEVELEKVHTDDNGADMMTKSLPRGKLETLPLQKSDHARQSYDFYKERFQPTDDLPFSYDEMNPIALEIYKGDRLSVLEQCHKTRKICIWVKHWLMLTSWTKLVVVDIPEFPLIYPRLTLLSTNYYFDKNNRLVITCNDTDMKGLSIIQVIKANEGECRFPFLCSYVPSVVRIPGFSKQDTSRIRWRKRRFN